jgi:hypothetical protein
MSWELFKKASVIFLDPGDTRNGGYGVRLKSRVRECLEVPFVLQRAFYAPTLN